MEFCLKPKVATITFYIENRGQKKMGSGLRIRIKTSRIR